MVAEAYERGKALSTATLFEIDDVIDPAIRARGSWRDCGRCRNARRERGKSERSWIRGEGAGKRCWR